MTTVISEIAELTETQKLTEIIDLDTGLSIDLQSFVCRHDREVVKARNELRRRYLVDPESPWLACELCGAAVQLVCHTDRKYYFRHMPEQENRGCPVNTKNKLTPDQILAAKYNGAKESYAHQHLKEIVRDSIIADPNFSSPRLEKIWRSSNFLERASWRKPDVQVEMNGRKLAFEIQLSTTFLSVIVERREFYRAEGGSLIWVFQSFDPSQTRRAEEDVFCNNNMNVFVVSDETLLRSRNNKRFSVDCWYPVPSYKYGLLVNEWQSEQVFVDELTFDVEDQRVYFFDYESFLADVESKRAKEETAQQLEKLRERFESFWFSERLRYDSDTPHQEVKEEWSAFKRELRAARFLGILPGSHWSPPFYSVISLMLSAKYGRPVGYGFKTLLEVTNLAFTSYKKFLRPFGLALHYYGADKTLDEQDRKGTWRKRKEIIRNAMRESNPEYNQSVEYNLSIAFLLPRISDKLNPLNLNNR